MRNKKSLWVILPVVMLSALAFTNPTKAVESKASLKTENAKCHTGCTCTDCSCGTNCTCLLCE